MLRQLREGTCLFGSGFSVFHPPADEEPTLAFQAARPEHALLLRFILGSAEALAWSTDGAGMCPSRQIFFSKYFPGGISGDDWDCFAPGEGGRGIFQLPAEMWPTAAAPQPR